MTDDQQTALLKAAQQFLPDLATSEVAIAAPGAGEGFWVGASSAVVHDGVVYLAYRLRHPIHLGRGQGVVIAKSADGVHFETIHMVKKEDMDAESLERPTLLRTDDGQWRLYVSCATTGTKHWRVELLEARDPADFDPGTREVVMPGSAQWAIKDTVIQSRDGLWHCWATMHPLEKPDHEDRMVSDYGTSTDGKVWDWHGTCLQPRPGTWDQRGARITAVQFVEGGVIALYDGRASAEENYDERTGIAVGLEPGLFTAVGSRENPFSQSPDGKALRYIDIVPVSDTQYRLYYEIARPDGAHELRTELHSY